MNSAIPPAPPRCCFAEPAVIVESSGDAGMLLRSPLALRAYARCVGEWLEQWARKRPDQVFLAEREAGRWHTVSYAAARSAVHAIAEALLRRRLGIERPVAILSDNGLAHALLALGAMHVGIPVVPISPAYSLMSRDFGKLAAALELIEPGLVFVDDATRFAAALGHVAPGTEIVSVKAPAAGMTSFDALTATKATDAVQRAHATVGADTVAKILLTSGSTGEPKGVVNTHGMLCANQQQLAQLWPFVEDEPLVLCDWLPWNHTFGGNHNFNLVLRNGGTLYIDPGKPVAGLIESTVDSLGEVSPTIYFNVPRGFDMLLPYLERDEALRKRFFHRLEVLFYAGAALPQAAWDRLEALSLHELGRRVRMASGWGSTETSPLATMVHFPIERAGVIGLPVPGCELKMVPTHGKYELRVRGPNVTPGYWKRTDLTQDAFDADGFYRIGDAGRLVDVGDPAKGLVFDGRIAEDFKLSSGTWVHVGILRLNAIGALAPLAQDVVVTGHDRDDVGLLVFPAPACRALAGFGDDAPMRDVVAHAALRAALHASLARLAATGAGRASTPVRAMFLIEPPSIDAGEITDKGYINQRAVLIARARLVERLYRDPPDPAVVSLTPGG